jgi:ubiquinol-cytochrome c reductase cytochrome c subunit
MRPFRLLVLTLLATSTHAPIGHAQDANRGKHLFMADGCYECHGTVGQGGAAAPRIAPDPLPSEAISAYIRQPGGVMPPYAQSVLNDQDTADIQAYLAGIPQPKAVKDIPLLAP